MALTPVFKSADDPYFNYEAAQRAFDMVMSMDDDTAEMFTKCVVTDALWADLDNNQRTLQRHLNSVIKKRIERVKKVLDRTYVSKAASALEDDGEFQEREKLLAYAGALSVIEKATLNPYEHGYRFQETDFRRDPSSGRFQTKVRYNAKAPALSDKQLEGMVGSSDLPSTRMTRGQRAEYAQGYQQVSDFLGTFEHMGLAGETDFLVTFQDKKNPGRTYTVTHSGTKTPTWDPERERPVAVQAKPNTLNAAGASFGLVTALGGSPASAADTAAMMGRAGEGWGSFEREWTGPPGDVTSSNARLYQRTAAGSKYVGDVAPPGSKLQMAAKFGELIGQHGPEAEKVLGPGARKTMYRYRGTEKTPDKELLARYERASMSAIPAGSQRDQQRLKGMQNKALIQAEKEKGSKLSRQEQAQIMAAVTLRATGQGGPDPSQYAAEARGLGWAAATDYMHQKVPNQKLYELQLASGHTPPSEGVILDRNGKIVTQAIGYGDDHYLPFNLKNLKGLKGGEYMRTRSVGGPTSEDIYTGLVAGASAVTVTSRSGTFRIEFDEEFRGGRRYNQKAARMVDRYEKLLDAVKSEQVTRMQIPTDIRNEIRDKVEEDFGDWGTPQQKKKEVQRLERQYKESPWISTEERKTIEAEANQLFPEGGKGAKRYISDKMNTLIDQRAYNYRLNGDGYAAAIESLQEQFPYYIKEIVYDPTRAAKYESEQDKGYVQPGRNRPTAARAGYFDVSVAGAPAAGLQGAQDKDTGKFSAADADYQYTRSGYSAGTRKPFGGEGGAAAPAQPQGVPGEGGAEGGEEANPQQQRAAAADARARREDINTAAKHAFAALERARGGASGGELAQFDDVKSEADMKRAISDPQRYKTFESAMKAATTQLQAKDDQGAKALGAEISREFRQYSTIMNRAAGEKFSAEKHLWRPTEGPLEFDGPEYKRFGNRAQKEHKLRELSRSNPIPGHPALINIEDDNEFKSAIDDLAEIRAEIDAYPNPRDDVSRMSIHEHDKLRNAPTAQVNRMIDEPEYLKGLAESVHRARTLRARIKEIDESEATTQPGIPADETVTEPRGGGNGGGGGGGLAVGFQAAEKPEEERVVAGPKEKAGVNPPEVTNVFVREAARKRIQELEEAREEIDSIGEGSSTGRPTPEQEKLATQLSAAAASLQNLIDAGDWPGLHRQMTKFNELDTAIKEEKRRRRSGS